jgi:hypothetical protein
MSLIQLVSEVLIGPGVFEFWRFFFVFFRNMIDADEIASRRIQTFKFIIFFF